MRHPLTIKEVKQKLKQIHGESVILDEKEYINTKISCRFWDKEYGEFWNTPNNVLCKGQGHKMRANKKRQETVFEKYGKDYYENLSKSSKRIKGINKKYTIDEINELLKSRNIIFFDKEYLGNHIVHVFKCLVCQNIWNAKTRKVVNGSGCPTCYGNKRYKIEEVKKILLDLNIILLSERYKNNREILKLKCIDCNNEWSASFGNIKNSNSGCPECAKEKRKQTYLKTIGYDNPQKSPIVREKTIKTFKEKHGVEYPYQKKEFLEKSQKTCELHWGEKYPAQNSEIALKTARKQTNRTILHHWKTQKEIVCVCSYEVAVVEWLNETKQEFDWQIRFCMPNGKKYFCDLYFMDKNLYAEVKGHFRKDAREKWEWFHKEYPNSELWDRQKLKELGLLKRATEIRKSRRIFE